MQPLRYVCISAILLSALALAQSKPASAINQTEKVSPPVNSSRLPSKSISGAARRTNSTPQLNFAPAVIYGSGGSLPEGVAMGDVNGDGKLDLVVANFCSTTENCTNGVVGVLLGKGDGTFQPAVSYNSGGYGGNAVAIVDVNGDGKLDIVVANWCANSSCVSGSVGILLGNGDGTFQPAVAYGSGGYETFSVAVGDLRGDGKLDLVVSNLCANDVNCLFFLNENIGTVGVLLGNGDGTFQPVVTYDSGGIATTSVAVADVNEDGKPDVISEECDGDNSCNPLVSVLLGNGDGTLQPAVTYGAGGVGSESAIVGDVNADGYPDIVQVSCGPSNGCNSQDGVVGVLLNNGNGTFQGTVAYNSGGLDTTSAALADVNGDGYVDITVMNAANSSNVAVLLGNGNGTFQNPVTFSAGSSDNLNGVQSLAVVDVNGDGRPDVIFVGGGETLGVLINTSIYPSTTTLTSSPNPSVVGESVTFTATVSQPLIKNATPTGTVTFYNGQTNLGTTTLSSTGVATLTTSTLPVGTQSITAFYSGDSNFASSTSPVLSQVVDEPTVQLSSTSLNFGDQTVGTASAPQTVTLTNTGNGPLTITRVSVSGPFAMTSTCGASVAAGTSCTFTVRFKPMTSGTLTGSISLFDNASGSPQKIRLAGTGTDIQLNPTSLNFGDQAVGTRSAPQKITLSNRSSVAVTITAISITGTDDEDFSELNTCGTGLAAGASCTISVTFRPSADGNRTADVSVSDDGGGSPQTVSLSGTGTGG